MRLTVQLAAGIAVVASLFTALFSAQNAGAASPVTDPVTPSLSSPPPPAAPRFVAQPVVQALPQPAPALPEAPALASAEPDLPEGIDSLAELVSVQPQPDELPRELQCLAGAIYFEARGETLAGQLAVGRVVVARSRSGRFPDSYCGVVFQHAQFSFVRDNALPVIRTTSPAWRNAVAIAQIAHAGSWRSPAEGALYFHAARVEPGWRRPRVARVDNHVFYR